MIAHYFAIGYCMMMYEMWPLLLQMMLFDRCAQLFCVRLIFCLTLCCHQMFAQLNRISTIACNGKSTNKCEANEKKQQQQHTELKQKEKEITEFPAKNQKNKLCSRISFNFINIRRDSDLHEIYYNVCCFRTAFFVFLFKGVDKKPWRFGFFCQ